MILEIALGIVLAILILAFLPQILALGVVALGIGLIAVISISVIALVIDYPTFGNIGIFIATAIALHRWTGSTETSTSKEDEDNGVESRRSSGGWSDESCDQCGGSFNPLAMRRCKCPSRGTHPTN